jgi:small-conductance mechanosensitive channel
MADTSPRRPGGPRRVVRSIPVTIGALRAIDAKAKPDLKRAVPAVLTAIVLFGVGERLGAAERRSPARFDMFGNAVQISGSNITIVVLALTLLLVVSGLIATRSVGRELARVVSARGGVEAGNAIRLVCFIAGYAILGLGVLALLHVNLANLLVGGAVTGVVVGIAAQQTLGNFFAGLVLLFARPYVPGQRVKIRSGAFGTVEGTITGSGLMYTTIDTSEGLISLPNSGLLAAAIGPAPRPVATEPDLPATPAIPTPQRQR